MLDAIKDLCMDNTGQQDISFAFQAAVDKGIGIYFPKGKYLVASNITIPQQSVIGIKGDGFRLSQFDFVGTGSMFIYKRQDNLGGSIFIVEDCSFNYASTTSKSSATAVNFEGFGVLKDDNWFRSYRCGYTNWQIAVRLKYCGQCYFVDNFYQANTYSHYLERGASFIQFRGCMSFDKCFIHASDTVGDAYSNGIVIEACNNIMATKENIFIEGWQAVLISKCGWDLGSGGSAALWFKSCQDVYIDKCFISSNQVVDRIGVWMDSTHTYTITDSTIVNNKVGVINSATVDYASKGCISQCKFENNSSNDIILFDNTRAVKISHCHFQTVPSRTGTNFEVFSTFPGVNNCILTENTFAGSAFPVNMGNNSIVGNNLFNVKP